MNFDITEEQEMVRETFARFLDDNSCMIRVRTALATSGHDAQLWRGLTDLGAISRHVPEALRGKGKG